MAVGACRHPALVSAVCAAVRFLSLITRNARSDGSDGAARRRLWRDGDVLDVWMRALRAYPNSKLLPTLLGPLLIPLGHNMLRVGQTRS